MKDLQKLSPEIVTINKSFEMEGAEMDKVHKGFKHILITFQQTNKKTILELAEKNPQLFT